MSKILFISIPEFGHLNPLYSIALQMQTEGHDVQFLVPGNAAIAARVDRFRLDSLRTVVEVPNMLETQGIAVDLLPVPLPLMVQFWAMKTCVTGLSGYRELQFFLQGLTLGLQYFTEQILHYIERNRPDAIATDFAFLASHLAAEIAGIPCANLYYMGLPFRGKDIPPFGSGLPICADYATIGAEFVRKEKTLLRRLDKRVNRVRRHFGLADCPSEFFRQPYSQWLNLIASTETIEAPRDNLTDNTFFVGPCFRNRIGQISYFPFDKLRRDRYKVYVSLGTIFNNKPEIYRKIIHALNQPEYQVIVSAGPAYQRLIRDPIPDNCLLFSEVPQVDLLPKVDLVITHGGTNTINETLAAGKPTIVIPIAGEQGDNASRVEYLQVGLRLDVCRFDELDLLNKVRVIQTNAAFQSRAVDLQASLDGGRGPARASALLHQLATTQAPVVHGQSLPPRKSQQRLSPMPKSSMSSSVS